MDVGVTWSQIKEMDKRLQVAWQLYNTDQISYHAWYEIAKSFDVAYSNLGGVGWYWIKV